MNLSIQSNIPTIYHAVENIPTMDIIQNFLARCRDSNLINNEEFSQFSNKDSFKIKDNRYLDQNINNIFKQLEQKLLELSKEIIVKLPDIIKDAFNFRDNTDHLIFENFADLFCFLTATFSEWGIIEFWSPINCGI